MIKKVLIANRGEIAVRVVRACREMGIGSVAVYTDADHHALHVKKADEAYSLGGDAVAGYLDVERIVELAVANGCDAIHPGYGFLSENPALAAKCEEAGIKFIGPNAAVISHMGDKIAARKAMVTAGIPVTPGSDMNLANLDDALLCASKVGYPVMLKATSGGGGRGIRRCDNVADLQRSYERVTSEAVQAFGSAEVFLEKYIENPRHIEVQIVADSYGDVVHLFERDCSIQRRHQKLIEIAPSPQLTDEQRDHITALAVSAAQAVGYENAGTVEFLLDSDDNFYFMEMNTRLQVEHTISEEISGIDIVKEQIRIAAGLPLSYKQCDIRRRGFAMEFRINAEDPRNGFLPCFGKISRYSPPAGFGVRTDSAIYSGYEIQPYYDSLCVKLTVWAMTWDELLARAAMALCDMEVYGVKTTIPYYLEILQHHEFRQGVFDTGFVEKNPGLIDYRQYHPSKDLAAVIAAAVAVHQGL